MAIVATTVVGVDGSRDSGQAVSWAAAEAAVRGTPLRIVYGLHMPIAGVPFSDAATLPPSPELVAKVENMLAAATEIAHAAQPDLEVETLIVRKPPSDALISQSATAGLIVVGTRGIGGVRSAILGSVSIRVAAHGTCPAVVIPRTATVPWTDAPVAVALDGSAQGLAAVRAAYVEAARRGTRLVAVHACREQKRADAERLVASVLDVVRTDPGDEFTAGTEVEVETRIVASRDPAGAVMEVGAALNVVGSRGRGAIAGVVLGSTSQALLRRAEEPVMVVHAG